MRATISDDFRESDQAILLERANIEQRLPEERLHPSVTMLGPCAGQQCVELFVLHYWRNFQNALHAFAERRRSAIGGSRYQAELDQTCPAPSDRLHRFWLALSLAVD